MDRGSRSRECRRSRSSGAVQPSVPPGPWLRSSPASSDHIPNDARSDLRHVTDTSLVQGDKNKIGCHFLKLYLRGPWIVLWPTAHAAALHGEVLQAHAAADHLS